MIISTDAKSESRLPLLSLNIYVPRDERFSHVKFSDFLAYAAKSLGQILIPEIASLSNKTINEFDSFKDVGNLYEGGIKIPDNAMADKLKECIPLELIKELLRNDGEGLFKFPIPDVIKGSYLLNYVAKLKISSVLFEGLGFEKVLTDFVWLMKNECRK